MYHGVDPKTRHKNHLIKQILNEAKLQPKNVLMIDSDFRTISDAEATWDEDDNKLQTLNSKPKGGFTLDSFGHLIGKSNDMKRIPKKSKIV